MYFAFQSDDSFRVRVVDAPQATLMLVTNEGVEMTVNIGSTLRIDNSGTVVADRINDATGINLLGRLQFVGNASASVRRGRGRSFGFIAICS